MLTSCFCNTAPTLDTGSIPEHWVKLLSSEERKYRTDNSTFQIKESLHVLPQEKKCFLCIRSPKDLFLGVLEWLWACLDGRCRRITTFQIVYQKAKESQNISYLKMDQEKLRPWSPSYVFLSSISLNLQASPTNISELSSDSAFSTAFSHSFIHHLPWALHIVWRALYAKIASVWM